MSEQVDLRSVVNEVQNARQQVVALRAQVRELESTNEALDVQPDDLAVYRQVGALLIEVHDRTVLKEELESTLGTLKEHAERMDGREKELMARYEELKNSIEKRASEAMDDLDALTNWIDRACEAGAVPVVTGANGDMDTVGSAVALATSRPEMRLRDPSRTLGEASAQRSERSIPTPGPQTSHVASPHRRHHHRGRRRPDQLGIQLPDAPRCVIDHHATHGWELGPEDHRLVRPVRATTQLVHAWMRHAAPEALSSSVRKVLLAGLVSDTGRFRHADHGAFDTATSLLAEGDIDYAGFIEGMEQDDLSRSDRGVLQKALDAGGRTTCRSLVGSQHARAGLLEGTVCSALIASGAEVAVCSKQVDGRTRITVRAPRSATNSGIHLGHMMGSLAERHGGTEVDTMVRQVGRAIWIEQLPSPPSSR